MAKRAQVTSTEALEAFRARLVVYREKAQVALDSVRDEIVQTRVWVQGEQREHCEHEVRRCGRQLEEARQARFGAEIATFRDTDGAQRAFTRARRELEAAREKLRKVIRVNRQFDSRVEPLARQTDELHDILSHDVPKAAAYLSRVVKTLDAYVQMAPPDAPAAGTDEAGDGGMA